MCGEQITMDTWEKTKEGSPPRVRGTVRTGADHGERERITPACAGNRSSRRSVKNHRKDHPRVCGEQLHHQIQRLLPAGSPPRVRGTESAYIKIEMKLRITPACAGNRLRSSLWPGMKSDHPRVCGEQTKKSPSFQHSLLSDQENSFSLKYNCSISSQSFCARWTSLQGSSKCFAKVDS